MKGKLTGVSLVVATNEQLTADLGGEAAILNLKDGVYYGLNPIGAQIWMLIQRPRRVAEIRDVIVKEHDVDAERCERELLGLLEDMATHGLVEVRG